MKRILKTLLVLAGLTPLVANSAVNVRLHKDVEALVVNGEALPMSLKTQNEFSFENGENQLVVRVSKLVSSDAEFEKFKTDPLVITLTAEDQDIVISPTKNITSKSHIKDFKQNPSFTIVTSNGQNLKSKQDVLPAGPGFMRDYEKELAKYNSKQGLTVVGTLVATAAGTSAVTETTKQANQELKTDAVAPRSNSENDMILLKADFLRLSSEDQQKFMRWAVENLRQ